MTSLSFILYNTFVSKEHRSTNVFFIGGNPMNTNVIETTRLCKVYSKLKALDNVSIHVPQGAIYGLVGDNGAGKSTLLKILAGQSFATSGSLSLLGCEGEKALRLARRHIGCLIEDPGFFPNMTVEQTLKYYSIQRGISDKRRAVQFYSLVQIYLSIFINEHSLFNLHHDDVYPDCLVEPH